MRKKKGIYLILIIFAVSFMGCIAKYNDKTIENIQTPKIGDVALYTYANNGYKLYNLDNERMLEVDSLGIKVYGKYNGIIIYTKDDTRENIYYNKNGEERDFPEFSGELIPNSDRTKVLYKKEGKDGSMNLYYFDFVLEKEFEINTDIYFSGNNLGWSDNENILIYGIRNLSEDKKENGLYSYNIKDNSEELVLSIEIGFIEYLKVENDIIYYLLSTEDKTYLNTYSLKTGEINESLSDFQSIDDIEVQGDDIYILGDLGSESAEIYKYNNNKLEQVTYDFPKKIDLYNNMILDNEGNIIFIGYDDLNIEKDIYVKEKDSNTIKIISEKSDDYNFVRK